jgi:hypothetical protein
MTCLSKGNAKEELRREAAVNKTAIVTGAGQGIGRLPKVSRNKERPSSSQMIVVNGGSIMW